MSLWIPVAANLSKAFKAHIESLRRPTSNMNMVSDTERAVHDQDVRLHRFSISAPCAIRRWDALVGLAKAANANMATKIIITPTIIERNVQMMIFPTLSSMGHFIGLNEDLLKMLAGGFYTIQRRSCFVVAGAMVRDTNGIVLPGALLGRSWNGQSVLPQVHEAGDADESVHTILEGANGVMKHTKMASSSFPLDGVNINDPGNL